MNYHAFIDALLVVSLVINAAGYRYVHLLNKRPPRQVTRHVAVAGPTVYVTGPEKIVTVEKCIDVPGPEKIITVEKLIAGPTVYVPGPTNFVTKFIDRWLSPSPVSPQINHQGPGDVVTTPARAVTRSTLVTQKLAELGLRADDRDGIREWRRSKGGR